MSDYNLILQGLVLNFLKSQVRIQNKTFLIHNAAYYIKIIVMPVHGAPALGHHEEDEVDEQHRIVQPQWDEDDEPGPSIKIWGKNSENKKN